MIDTTDNTVTVCMDYIKSRCSREKCKYFHPPAHLQAKIKSSQQQINQTAVAAQAAAAAAAVVSQSVILLMIDKVFIIVLFMKLLNVECCIFVSICNGTFSEVE